MKRNALIIALVALVAGGTIAGLAIARSSPSHATAKKAKLQLRSGKLGRFIVDARGMTVYLFEKDKNGKSACNGACPKVWAPYLTSGKPSVAAGLSSSKAGTTKRSDGTTQATYNGHPLYHYDDDKKPGQTEGQGSKEFGAEWYVLSPKGMKVETKGS
jgi:predicted lipoprotein with Yx(FWY)xxD motif